MNVYENAQAQMQKAFETGKKSWLSLSG